MTIKLGHRCYKDLVPMSGWGDNEAAIASLEKAYAAHDLQLQTLKVSADFDSLRADPRFQDLLRRVGLET